MAQMGYMVVDGGGGLFAFYYVDHVSPIFLHIGDLETLPLSAVDSLLETAGINLDTFHAHLESLWFGFTPCR